MKSFRPKAEHTQCDDDPGDPPSFDTKADDQPDTTAPDPMHRTRPGSRNAEVDFRGAKRSNETCLYNGSGRAALQEGPRRRGRAVPHRPWLMENRNGLIV